MRIASARPGTGPSRRVAVLAAICAASTLLFLGLAVGFRETTPGLAMLGVLAALGVCTVALARAAPVPAEPASAGRSKTMWPALLVGALAAFVLLMLASDQWGNQVVFGLVGLALLTWLILRRGTSARLAAYFAGLGLLAGVGTLLLYRDRSDAWLAGLWMAVLVPVSLLGGRALLHVLGMLQAGYGVSLAERSPRALALGVLAGLACGTPWALANLLLSSGRDTWIYAWPQVLGALGPGIAEEAWARVFLVALLTTLFVRLATTRVALTAAILVAGCWFGYLHQTPGIGSIPSGVLLGLLYSTPLALLWLRWGMETGMAFHFWQDALRFAVDVWRA